MSQTINRLKRWKRTNRHPYFVWLAGRIYRWGPLLWKDLLATRHRAKFHKELGCIRTPEEWVSFAFHSLNGTIRPYQIRSEITALMQLLQHRKPRRILEIGTANGGTLFLLCRALDPKGVIVSIDLPGGWFGGGYPLWRKHLYRSFATGEQRVELLRANSHDLRTLEMADALVERHPFDLIFIDGDHTYDGAKQDFMMYRRLLAPNGSVAFHDIVPHTRDPDCDVARLWAELKGDYNAVEFVEDWTSDFGGIGVLTDVNSGNH